MSGPVRPPLKTQLDNDTSENRPVNTIAFANTDFTLTNSGTKTTVGLSGGGGGTIGGTIAATQVAFGSAADTITGSDNFTFVDETPGNGPYLRLKGDKPYISIEDDTDTNNYKTNFQQNGLSLYLTVQTNDATEYQLLRAVGGSTGDFIINPQMRDKDTYVSGDTQQYLLFVDAGEDRVGIGTNTPEKTLDVGGDMQLNRSGATGSLTRKLFIEGARFDTGSDYAQLVFSNYDGGEYEGAVIAARNDPDGVKDGTLVFRTANNDTLQDMMSITNNLIHINDVNNNFDFRVDGEYTDNLFRCDGSRSSVGILTQPDDDVSLHIKDNNSQDVLLRLETDENSADKSPALEFYKNSAADISDYIMAIDVYGLDDGGAKSEYARIATYIEDETAATENGVMIFQVAEAGSLRSNFVIGSTLVTVNGGSRNVDFRHVNDAGSINFYSDAGTGTVAIGGTPANSDSTLTIYDTGTAGDSNLELISTQDDLDAAPILSLFRDDIPSASDQTIGQIKFYGRDIAGTKLNMAQISAFVNDATAGGVESTLKFQTLRTSGSRQLALWDSYQLDFNPSGADINFRIRSNNRADMLFVDGGTDEVGIYSAPSTGLADNNPVLQVNGSVSSKCAIVTKTSATVDLSTRDSNELIGQLYVLTSASAKTLTVPTSCTQGDWFRVLTTGANGMDIVSTGGATLNGATPASLNRDAQNEIYTVVAIATDKWVCTSN